MATTARSGAGSRCRVQFYFVADRVKALAPQRPEGKSKETFASLLKGDLKAALEGGDHWRVQIGMVYSLFD